MDTDVPGLRALREWYSAVQTELGYGLGSQGIPSEAVLGLSESIVKAVAQLREGSFNEHLAELSRLLEQLGEPIPSLKRGRLDGEESVLTEVIGLLDSALRIFRATGIKEESTIEQLTQIPALLQKADNLENLAQSDPFAQDALGNVFEGIGTDQEKLDQILLLARKVHECNIPQSFKLYLLNQGTAASFQDLKTSFSVIAAIFSQMEQRGGEFTEFAKLDLRKWFGARSSEVTIDQFLTRAEQALPELGSLSQWTNYMRSRDQLKEKQLLDFADIVEGEQLPLNQVIPVYRYLVYHKLARVILQKYPELRQFNGHDQNVIRQRFIQCDEGVISLQQQKIASKIDRRSVPTGVDRGTAKSRTELRLLEHEAGLQKSKTKIRQLIGRGGKALQALKPCFMMGPLSVAQYLEPGKLTFDLVVMDEASQVRPEDALGAVARGGQLVVVGDQRQLPPTRFFDRMFGGEEEEEDETVLQAAESILDASINIFQPTRRLLWHYRSRHESLIAFSNHHFYSDNPLIVFPSPHPADPRYGVRFVGIEDGIFKNSRNVPEAKRIAQAVIKHMKTNRGESLGVVAMNNPQSELIAEEVDRLLKEDPQAQSYLESYSNHSEPFFVKNLENVQGDERDVIFISFTYGRSETGGTVAQRFGPITHDVGWRRLNVLFTRAKNSVVAFSSMSSSDIRGGPEVSDGTRALKNYLAYAETGILEQALETGRPPDSDFEVAVADALQRAGYECVAQVGVAGFFIDLAVRHPDLPGKYLLGVECDGATYHSARSVRDRDRLRQAVLENLGWVIHRIWSTDWFRDPQSEVRRVLDKLAELREEEVPIPAAIPVEEMPPTIETMEETEVVHEEQIDIELVDAEEEIPPSEQFLTAEQAREMLIELREGTIKVEMPDGDTTEGFLRKSMLDALLRNRPKSKEEFSRKIPYNLREKMDIEQFARYHERVFDILAQIVSPQQQSLF